MDDTMTKELEEKTAAEENAIKLYDELMAAKTKEDLSDTQEALIEDTKFLADLEKNCKTVGADYEARQKTRGEELVAIADTIKVLNDDDALELFKKTLPGASASLIQMAASKKEMRTRALVMLRKASKVS